jgi:Ca2+-binding RTX toxin-like protein
VGEDLILGDNGQFQYTEVGGVAVLTGAQTTDTTAATGGNDVIVGGGGTADNIVLAGMGDDQVNQGVATSSGADLVLGDNGYVTWGTDGLITSFGSSQLGLGGNDLIDVGDGANIVVGGDGNDTITTGIGSDVVLGDNGAATYTNVGGVAVLTNVQTTDTTATTGGNDTIIAGIGDNVVLAGMGADTVTMVASSTNTTLTGTVAAGDTWVLDLVAGGITTTFTYVSVAGDGLAEVVAGLAAAINAVTSDGFLAIAEGASLVVLEQAGTSFTATYTVLPAASPLVPVVVAVATAVVPVSNGADVVLGDNGSVTWDTAGLITLVVSTQPGLGGNDMILVGDGTNVVVAGFGNDTITTGIGSDIVIGDNGMIDATSGAGMVISTTDTVNATGGNDVINAGDGNNLVLAGVGNDFVSTGVGADTVVGDNGAITVDTLGAVVFVTSTGPLLGGSDAISTGNGNDVMIGGALGDVLASSGGNDILFGDGGSVAYAAGGADITILSVDPMFGGDDSLNGGTGADILIGGQGSDLLYGTLSEDLLFGSNAAVTLSGWRVTSMQSDLYDLVTESMFDQFSAGKGKGAKVAPSLRVDLSTHLIEISDELSESMRGGAPLDAGAFRYIFKLGGYGQAGSLRETSLFNTLGKSGSVTLSPVPARDLSIDGAGDADSGGLDVGDSATPQAAWRDDQHPLVAGVPVMLPAAADARGNDAMVLALGIAGLSAAQQPKAGGRRSADRYGTGDPDAGRLSRVRRAWTSIAPR